MSLFTTQIGRSWKSSHTARYRLQQITRRSSLIVVKYKIMENSHVIDDALLSKICPVFSEPRLNQNGIKQQWQASCPKYLSVSLHSLPHSGSVHEVFSHSDQSFYTPLFQGPLHLFGGGTTWYFRVAHRDRFSYRLYFL